ncbi:MAG: hypothetical protein FP816_18585 [Desulfobacteraceae bacterium]|nr:hypothetical protein [Desulfobacteraceae bacterium]
MMKTVAQIFCLAGMMFLTGSCSVRKMVIHEMAEMTVESMAVFEEDSNLDLIENALPSNMKLLEVMLEKDPGNKNLLEVLARMYGSYGFAFYETRLEALSMAPEVDMTDVVSFPDTNVPRMRKALEQVYLKGLDYAVRALAIRYENCRDQLKTMDTTEDFIRTLTLKDVPALFWYGFNLGGYVNLNRDSVSALAMVPLVEKAMNRVVELDPDYFNAGAHLYLLAFHGSRSPLMGGNPEAARLHYEELRKRAGQEYLLADVFYARYYLYQSQDREAFEKLLNRVLETKDEKKYALMNQVARIRAGIYLKAMDDLFP